MNTLQDEHQKGIRTVYLVKKEEESIGYASLFLQDPNFKHAGIPEINDVWISKDFRHKGFGKMLLQHIEKSALSKGYQQIGIGVGLYTDYGIARETLLSVRVCP